MEFISGNVFIRPMRFSKVGDVVHGHAHNFDHTTYVVKGALKIEQLAESRMEVDPETGVEVEVDGGVVRSVIKRASDGQNWVLIKAGVIHRLTAVEPDSLGHCIYAHRTPQGDVVETYEGWSDSYV